MTDQEAAIIERCRELGIDHGPQSLRNFIRAAEYHATLPGTLPGDIAVAYNTAIRRVTQRIACRGMPGISRGESRLLSRAAETLRQAILDDPAVPDRRKCGLWLKQVTEEHQDPVDSVQRWIEAEKPTVDDVVLRLLMHPPVIVTCEENKRIPGRFRTSGTPAERYDAAAIEPVLVEEGTFDFFRKRLAHGRPRRPGKYHLTPLDFEVGA
jgi:hypothetical protein